MKKYRIKSLIVVALVALSAVAAPHKSILSLKESITDDNIQFPYSFETNTQELMKNWYLQNYAVLDKDVENKDPGDVSDATYISRLKTIPSGIELPFNQVVKSYIERYTHRERTLVAEMLGMSPYYMPIFEQALEKRGMPLELKYIPVIESALDPNAVSPVGASGLWQFMLETARNQGLEVNSLVDERRDPYRSSDAAADYFKKLYDIYGDWSLAIAAYNCGPGNVNKALLRAGDGSAKPDFWEIYNYLPRETRGYVPAFIAATYVMHYYKEHNISPSLATKPLLIDTVKVNQRLNFAQISKVLNIPIDEIRILNPQYRHDVIPGDARPYTLALPSQQVYSFILVEDSINSYRPDLYAARDVREPGTPNDAPTANNYGYSAPTMQAPAQPATQAVAAQPATQAAAAQPAATPATAAAATKYYKVKRGEDIESVASSFGISVDQLMTLNSLTRRHVSRGQVLKVPDVAQKAAAAPSQPAQPHSLHKLRSRNPLPLQLPPPRWPAARQAAPIRPMPAPTASTTR
jgi:membrane-bound lytic murein transglycosylase D